MEKNDLTATHKDPSHRQLPPCGDVRSYLTAAAMQNLNLVHYFVEVAAMPVDATEPGKPTALCYAAARRNVEMLAFLLANGADPNYADEGGHTVMHYAALGGCIETVAKLIVAGAMINRENAHGTTPLGLAKEASASALCAELLTRYGATLNAGPPRPTCFH